MKERPNLSQFDFIISGDYHDRRQNNVLSKQRGSNFRSSKISAQHKLFINTIYVLFLFEEQRRDLRSRKRLNLIQFKISLKFCQRINQTESWDSPNKDSVHTDVLASHLFQQRLLLYCTTTHDFMLWVLINSHFVLFTCYCPSSITETLSSYNAFS